MSGKLQQRSSSLAVSPTTNDDFDSDSISITSTIEPEESSDTEYVVDGIHAERTKVEHGRSKKVFLVEWANFPLDQCTWEPLENLSKELAEQWRNKKVTQDAEVAHAFEKKYEAAYNQCLEKKRARHRRRNLKRKRLGIPTTPFYFRNQLISDSEDEAEIVVLDSPDSDVEQSGFYSSDGSDREEAAEDDVIDHRATAALEKSKTSSKAKVSKPKTKSALPVNRVFKYQPPPLPQLQPDKAHPAKSLPAKKDTAKGKTADSIVSHPYKSATGPTTSAAKEGQRLKFSKRAGRDLEPPSSTGYQGSARRSSTGETSTRPAEISKAKSSTPKLAMTRPDKSGTVAAASTKAAMSTAATASSKLADKVLPTMRKSVTKKAATLPLNVFDGGKTRKKRKTMGDKEQDPEKAMKHYDNHSKLRQSELRSRDRNDQGPPIDKIAPALFAPGAANKAQPAQQNQKDRDDSEAASGSTVQNISHGQQDLASTGLNSGPAGPNENPESTQEQRSLVSPVRAVEQNSTPSHAIPVRENKKRSSLSVKTDGPRKKTKTVRFNEAELGPSTPVETSNFPKLSSVEGECWIPSSKDNVRITDDDSMFVSEPMDIDDNEDSYKSDRGRTVSKKVRLSSSPAAILNVMFNPVPTSDDDQQWLQDFLGLDCLDVGHSFLAESLVSQLVTLTEFRPLCSGSITSGGGGESLKVIAEHLRTGSSGLFMAKATFNLVLFPTKCAEFDKLSDFGVDLSSPADIVLKYFIFSSAEPIFQLMRPSSSTVQGLKAHRGKEKLLLFPMILGMQHSKIISPSSTKRPWHFYLAFPRRAGDWETSIGSWLSMRDEAYKIYTHLLPGSWLAFREILESKSAQDRGVIIIHEALVPVMRRFRGFHKLLTKTSVVVWQFTETLGLTPPHPLTTSNHVPVLPSRLSRMFPLGSVILVTPSFLVAEPQEAFKLIQWFFKVRAKHPHNKLVLAHNIVEYLSELSAQKAGVRSKLEKDVWRHKNDMQIATDKNMAALTDEDLAIRQKTWFYVDWWISQAVDAEVPYSENNPIIFADRSIDPNDEQSLVNWFGMWSMERSQDYRKFYVVGSSDKRQKSSYTLTSRSSCRVLLPKYARSVVNDPDEAMRLTLKRAAHLAVPNGPQNVVFQSQCFQNDESQMKPWLTQQDKTWDKFIYNNAVSWADNEMAEHFGDSAKQFATIQQWWDSMPPWDRIRNTHVSFFYTISEDWDPDRFQRGVKPRRHPWVVIWRPCDVHKPDEYSKGRAELIIWDVRAGYELESKHPPKLQDLTWMQRMLVNHVRIHAHEKNPNSFLQRVWLGGFALHQASLGSNGPVDLTAEWLAFKLKLDLFTNLPAAAYHLVAAQYRQVFLPATDQPDSARTDEQGNTILSTLTDADDSDERIIYHPPRVGEVLKPGTSKCTNLLFEAARRARVRNPAAKDMIYTYPATLDWYREQALEGRQFEHIMVDEWQVVFDRMRVEVERPGPVPLSAISEQTPHVPFSHNSTGSVSSNHSSSTY